MGGSPALLYVRERSGIMACRGAAGGGVNHVCRAVVSRKPLKTAGSFSRFGRLQSPCQDLPNEIIQFPALLIGRRAR